MHKKALKYGIAIVIFMALAYCCAIFALRQNFYLPALIRPYAYMTSSQVTAAKIIALFAGVVCLFLVWLIHSTKNKSFDPVLGAISFIIPVVGLVLGILYRVRQQKNIHASNAYLIFSGASILFGVVVGVIISSLA